MAKYKCHSVSGVTQEKFDALLDEPEFTGRGKDSKTLRQILDEKCIPLAVRDRVIGWGVYFSIVVVCVIVIIK